MTDDLTPAREESEAERLKRKWGVTLRDETPAETLERLRWDRVWSTLRATLSPLLKGPDLDMGATVVHALRVAVVNEINEQVGGGDLASLAGRLDDVAGWQEGILARLTKLEDAVEDHGDWWADAEARLGRLETPTQDTTYPSMAAAIDGLHADAPEPPQTPAERAADAIRRDGGTPATPAVPAERRTGEPDPEASADAARRLAGVINRTSLLMEAANVPVEVPVADCLFVDRVRWLIGDRDHLFTHFLAWQAAVGDEGGRLKVCEYNEIARAVGWTEEEVAAREDEGGATLQDVVGILIAARDELVERDIAQGEAAADLAPAVGAEAVAWRRRVQQTGTTEWSGWGMWMQDPAQVGFPDGWEQEVQPLGVIGPVSPGDPIAEVGCPCCGAALCVEHGEEPGEVVVVGVPVEDVIGPVEELATGWVGPECLARYRSGTDWCVVVGHDDSREGYDLPVSIVARKGGPVEERAETGGEDAEPWAPAYWLWRVDGQLDTLDSLREERPAMPWLVMMLRRATEIIEAAALGDALDTREPGAPMVEAEAATVILIAQAANRALRHELDDTKRELLQTQELLAVAEMEAAEMECAGETAIATPAEQAAAHAALTAAGVPEGTLVERVGSLQRERDAWKMEVDASHKALDEAGIGPDREDGVPGGIRLLAQRGPETAVAREANDSLHQQANAWEAVWAACIETGATVADRETAQNAAVRHIRALRTLNRALLRGPEGERLEGRTREKALRLVNEYRGATEALATADGQTFELRESEHAEAESALLSALIIAPLPEGERLGAGEVEELVAYVQADADGCVAWAAQTTGDRRDRYAADARRYERIAALLRYVEGERIERYTSDACLAAIARAGVSYPALFSRPDDLGGFVRRVYVIVPPGGRAEGGKDGRNDEQHERDVGLAGDGDTLAPAEAVAPPASAQAGAGEAGEP